MSGGDFLFLVITLFLAVVVVGVLILRSLFRGTKNAATKTTEAVRGAGERVSQSARRGKDAATRKAKDLRESIRIPRELRALVKEARKFARDIEHDKISFPEHHRNELAGIFKQADDLRRQIDTFEQYLGKLYRASDLDAAIAQLDTDVQVLKAERPAPAETRVRTRLKANLLATKERQVAELGSLKHSREDAKLAMQNLHGLLATTTTDLTVLASKEAVDGEIVKDLDRKLTVGSEALAETIRHIQEHDPDVIDYDLIP